MLTFACSGLLQLSHLNDVTLSADRLGKDIGSDLPPNLLSGIKSLKTTTQTPAPVPPGLSSSQDFPPLAAPQPVAPAKVHRKSAGASITSSIKPAIPVLPGQQPRTAAPVKETREAPKVPQPDNTDAPSNLADAKNPLETPFVKHEAKAKNKTKLVIGTSSRTKVRAKNASSDIPTAKEDMSKKDMESVTTSATNSKSIDPVSISSIVTPPAPPASSPTRQTHPRTIRVLPTPKEETPPRLNPASPLAMNTAAPTATSKQLSRRPSLTSIQLPGTPVSEKISDNASFTSTSMSRANSPPPSKVGTAPVRQVTKSQQKKERQVRAKIAEEASKSEGSSSKPIAEESVQAPIVGRKKKAKKAARGTADSTPVATRPPSPIMKDEFSQDKQVSRPATPVKDSRKDVKVESDFQDPETPASPVTFPIGDQHQKNPLTAASIISNLQKSGEISSAALDLFKGVSGVNYRFELTQSDLTEPTIPVLSEAERRQIEDGEAIVVELGNSKNIVLLPDGGALRGLNKEQAQRYLELRKQALSATEATMFNFSRHDFDRYLHAVPHTGTTAQQSKPTRTFTSSDEFTDLVNRFVAPASAPASTTATMPSYWSPTPLTDEAMARKLAMVGSEEAEQTLLASRKETEGLEKKLNGLLKRNRRLIFGNSH